MRKPSGKQGGLGTGSEETLFRCSTAAEPAGPGMVLVAKQGFDRIGRVPAHESPSLYLQPCLSQIRSLAMTKVRLHTPHPGYQSSVVPLHVSDLLRLQGLMGTSLCHLLVSVPQEATEH